MYRFLLTRRWLGLLALVVVMAVACVLLGSWQLDRRDQRLERNAQVVDNYDLAPAPLDSVLVDGDLPAERTWTPVALEGEYVEEATVLVRNRPLDGRPGYEVLVPLRTDAGTTLVVNRGWVPTGRSGQEPDAVPAPPSGPVEVVARLRPAEPRSDRDAPSGQSLTITPGTFTGSDVVAGAYGALASESPAPGELLEAAPRPALDEGPHLSYAMQWVVFALMGLAGFVVLARRTAEWDAEDAVARGGVPRPTASRRPDPTTVSRRRPTAEDEEDALVDAAERASEHRQEPRPTRPVP